MSEVVQLYKDKNKTQPVYPKVLTEGTYNSDGTTIDMILQNMKSQVDASNGCIDILWGGGLTHSPESITLKRPFTDYDMLILVFCHEGEQVITDGGFIFSTCYPVPLLKEVMQYGAHIATFGYSTRFRRYKIPNATTFQQTRNGDSGDTRMIGIYGCKFGQQKESTENKGIRKYLKSLKWNSSNGVVMLENWFNEDGNMEFYGYEYSAGHEGMSWTLTGLTPYKKYVLSMDYQFPSASWIAGSYRVAVAVFETFTAFTDYTKWTSDNLIRDNTMHQGFTYEFTATNSTMYLEFAFDGMSDSTNNYMRFINMNIQEK